jgi:hypothetical protein
MIGSGIRQLTLYESHAFMTTNLPPFFVHDSFPYRLRGHNMGLFNLSLA